MNILALLFGFYTLFWTLELEVGWNYLLFMKPESIEYCWTTLGLKQGAVLTLFNRFCLMNNKQFPSQIPLKWSKKCVEFEYQIENFFKSDTKKVHQKYSEIFYTPVSTHVCSTISLDSAEWIINKFHPNFHSNDQKSV